VRVLSLLRRLALAFVVVPGVACGLPTAGSDFSALDGGNMPQDGESRGADTSASGADSGTSSSDRDGSEDASASPPTDASEGDTADAESDAAPLESGSPACSSAFCEDFESGQIDPATWTVQTSAGNTVMVQRAKAAHGQYAAQFHSPGIAKSYDFIIASNVPPQLRGHHYGRAYVLVDPKLPVGHTGLMFAGSSGFPRLKYLEVAGVRGGWMLAYIALAGAPTGETDDRVGCDANSMCVSSIQMPVGVWTCIEWEFNDQPDLVGLTDDGAMIATDSPILFGGKTSDLVGGFTDFGFGFYEWHPDNFAFDVYYDDIALDTKPVGCL
jgi:hypothetical protein